jgi:uncharacterized membrane protein YgcG
MVATAVLVAMAATPLAVATPVCVYGGIDWLPLLLASVLIALLHVKPHFSFLCNCDSGDGGNGGPGGDGGDSSGGGNAGMCLWGH